MFKNGKFETFRMVCTMLATAETKLDVDMAKVAIEDAARGGTISQDNAEMLLALASKVMVRGR